MTQQGDVESRVAWCIGSKGRRRCRCHLPPSLCSARHRFGVNAQQQCQDTRSCSCHRKPPRCREIEQRGLSPRLDHDGAHLAAFDDVTAGAKHGERIRRIDQNKVVGIKSEFDKAGGVEMSNVLAVPAFANPNYGITA